MVGRLTKPIVLYAAAIGSYLLHTGAPRAEIDLVLGAFIIFGFLLDKEAVDVWYRSNAGKADIEDTYAVNSEHAVRGRKRVLTRIFVGSRSIPAFLVYQIIAAVAIELGVRPPLLDRVLRRHAAEPDPDLVRDHVPGAGRGAQRVHRPHGTHPTPPGSRARGLKPATTEDPGGRVAS